MKYNKKTVGLTVTTNYEGAPSYTLSPEFELYAAVVTASLGNKFYESEEQLTERIRSLIKINKPEFVAKLAVYTREKMYLRSVPLALVCELANIHSGNNLLRKMTSRVIQRADEITELLACYLQANNRTGTKKLNKISKQLQKGIADAFNKFNEYQFAKYNRAGEITLKDALFLTHPKAITETQQTLFNKIVEDKLEVPYTWEVELSRLGQTTFINEEEKATAFKEKWEEIIKSNKLGYMALLRNLRNIIKARVNGECQEIVYNKLSDPEEVRKSKQFPFRFYSAYKMIEGELWVDRYTDALEKAIQVSVENVKGFEEDTRVVIACDVSGSM
ncbi:MAG: TROVE domain-containing protein, partial [Clostridia bacterium]